MRTNKGSGAAQGADSSGERPRKGALIEVEVESIAQGGDAFGRLEGMAVFLDRGLPGERVAARVVLSKRRHLRARVEGVVRAAPGAEESACAVSERCGGCRFWRAPYADEVAWKSAAAAEAVTRIAGDVVWPTPSVVPAPSVQGYRTRARFRPGPSGGSGFLESRSRRVVVSERCLVVHPAIDAARAAGMSFFAGLEGLESVFFEWDAERLGVAVTGEFSTRSMTEALRIIRSRVARRSDRCLEEFTTVVVSARGRHHETVGDGTVWRRRGGRVSVARESALEQGGGVERAGGVVIRDPVRSFSQTYDLMNVELTERVVEAAKTAPELGGPPSTESLSTESLSTESLSTGSLSTESLSAELSEPAQRPAAIELFAGSGNLTFPLIEAGFDVDAVEGAPGPVAAAAAAWKAQQALANNPLGGSNARAKFHVADLSEGLEGVTLERLDAARVIVTDPPRGGMSPALVQQLTEARAATTMVYVSCDPPAMARDVSLLARGGWRVQRWSLLDMFPRTPHVEALVLLTRSPRRAFAASPTTPSDALARGSQ